MARVSMQSGGEVTSPGNGKIPTVTRILLEGPTAPGADRPDLRWISGIPANDLAKLKIAAEKAMEAGAGIITLNRAAGGYELGLRPRVSGDSSRHPVQIKMNDNWGPLTAKLKSMGCLGRDDVAGRKAPRARRELKA